MPAWETTRERKMTGTDPELRQRRLRWAAEQLGLKPDASLDEVRAAWLRRLPAEDFVPSSELRWALTALLRRQNEGGWEARADEAAAVAEEERLRSEVEAFTEQFWDISVSERRRRWEQLRDRCAFAPALRARLRLLEAGLDDVSIPDKAGERTRTVELAGHLRDLFALRPGVRARARQSLLLDMEGDREEWKHAAHRLRYAYPKLAALGNDLLDKIIAAVPIPKSLPKKPPPQPTAAKSELASPLRYLWILVSIAVGLFRAACIDRPSSPPTEKWREVLQEGEHRPAVRYEDANERVRQLLKQQREENRKQEKTRKNDKTGGKYP